VWQLIKLAIDTFHSVNSGGAYPDLSFVRPAVRYRLGPLSKPVKVGQRTLVIVRQAIYGIAITCRYPSERCIGLRIIQATRGSRLQLSRTTCLDH
jgi:hypothetical protein